MSNLSEEEKKAIEILEKFITEHKLFNIKSADNLENNIKILLNLIEKQQKEIEEYNKRGQILNNVMNAKDTYMYKMICENFVPKDKIREDLINKYENEIYKDGVLTKLNSFDLLRAIINDLEELLEEE